MRYFKHDSDAHADAKLRKLRLRYGMEGYGVYWYILELIARNVDRDNLTFELEHDAELIAADTGLHTERVEHMMRYMVELRLFENTTGIITCLKMAARADEYTGKLLASLRRDSGQTPESVGTKSVLIEEKRTEENRTEENTICDLRKRSPPVPVAEIVELYHEMLCPPLPRVEKLTDTRRGYIQQRWRQDLTDLEHWRNFFEHVRGSDFLMGRAKARDGRPPFRADLEWLCRPTNYTKIAEDKYHVAVR